MPSSYQRQLTELRTTLQKDKREKEALVPKGAENRAREFERLSEAANTVRQQVEQLRRQQQAIDVLGDYVNDFRNRLAEDALTQLKLRHRDVQFDDTQWSVFKTDFVGDVGQTIDKAQAHAASRIKHLEGETDEQSAQSDSEPQPPQSSFLPKGQDLTALPLALLSREENRLQRLIGIDADKRKRHKVLSEKIRQSELQIKKLEKAVDEAKGADNAIEALIAQRSADYEGVFQGLVAEEEALQKLYLPLSDRLRVASGALGKLTFSVKRVVDVAAWAQQGESLIDTRRTGDFQGRGALLEVAERELAPAWRTGDATQVSEAMKAFIAAHDKAIIEGAKADRTNKAGWLAWRANVSEWLYGTNHISLTYGMRFERVDIETLSPGTRGIVLLLLYLAIDLEDDRPLIIDQPEENLDPKSIFDELVGLFRRAKQRRQIIIVTHNANLIVNTDADQVIVARCGELRPGHLPRITYKSGALEDPTIRHQVCDILEGGEQAFKQRAKRLGVSLK
ncbi:MAG: AAA family ATPase [Chromatiaceae bacterium]|nr:AAA family ATPase [Chromatiaceae bacterium]